MKLPPQPGDKLHWHHPSFPRVEVVKPFRPLMQNDDTGTRALARDIGESVIKTKEGVFFITRNEELFK